MNEGSVAVFFYPATGRLSVCVYGTDKDVQSLVIRKGLDGLPMMKLTEASGKVTQFNRAGATEIATPTAGEIRQRVKADIQRFFDAEEGCD